MLYFLQGRLVQEAAGHIGILTHNLTAWSRNALTARLSLSPVVSPLDQEKELGTDDEDDDDEEEGDDSDVDTDDSESCDEDDHSGGSEGSTHD